MWALYCENSADMLTKFGPGGLLNTFVRVRLWDHVGFFVQNPSIVLFGTITNHFNIIIDVHGLLLFSSVLLV